MEWATAHSPRPRGTARDKYSSEKTQGHRLLPPTDPYHHEYVDAGSPVASCPQVEQLPCEAKGPRPRVLARAG